MGFHSRSNLWTIQPKPNHVCSLFGTALSPESWRIRPRKGGLGGRIRQVLRICSHGTTFETLGCAGHVTYLSKMKVVAAYQTNLLINSRKGTGTAWKFLGPSPHGKLCARRSRMLRGSSASMRLTSDSEPNTTAVGTEYAAPPSNMSVPISFRPILKTRRVGSVRPFRR
jgi:hypothetical protein